MKPISSSASPRTAPPPAREDRRAPLQAPTDHRAAPSAPDDLLVAQLQGSLQANQARFETLKRLSSEWYWEQDTQFRFTRLVGTGGTTGWLPTDSGCIGRCRWEVPASLPLEGTWEAHRAELEAHRPFRNFCYSQPRSGECRIFSVSGEPAFDADGRFAGYRGIARDITESKQAEQHLRDSRQLLADIVENLPVAVLLKTVADDFRIVMWNRGAEQLYGISRAEALDRRACDLWPKEEAEDIRASDLAIVANRRPVEMRDRPMRSRRGLLRVHMRKRVLLDAAGQPTHVLVICDDTTARLEAEAMLRESEARFRSLTGLSSDWYWEQDAQYRFVPVTDVRPPQFRALVQFGGMTRWEMPGAQAEDGAWARHRAQLEARQPFHDFEYSRPNRQGEPRHVSISGTPIFDDAGTFIGYRGIGRDITERKRAEEALRRHAMQQNLIASFGQQALASSGLEPLFDEAVAAVARGLGVELCHLVLQADSVDTRWLVLQAGLGWDGDWIGRRYENDGPRTLEAQVLATGTPASVDDLRDDSRFEPTELMRAHDVCSAVDVPVCGVHGSYGVLGACARERRPFTPENINFLQSLAHVLATAIDRQRAHARLTYLAQFDALSGLPNRSLFLDRFGQTLAQARRSGWLLGVLFIDLDRFKVVNDTLGHAAGDKLLVQVARRLEACIRSGDIVGRLGGDEFAFVLSNIARADDAGLVAQKVIDQMARPFELEGQELYVSASVGISIHPGDGDDADLLLRNADTAMYRAKHSGGGFQFYLPQMNERAAERLKLESQLRGALERNEFVLHYQPKADLASGQISGFEALLRWQHPSSGLMPPVEFISLLEDTGLIVPVGEWVVRTVCGQLRRWQGEGVPLRPVAINLSARQFHQSGLDAVIARIVTEFGIAPGLLEFELTESMLMANAEAAVKTLTSMKAFGVRLSVDDFGTGFSSLAYLKRFPIDALKIDRAFIRDIISDPDDAAITLAIINLAHSMKLKVVAEGVETQQQLDFLKDRGCDEIQGFFFARPLVLEACTAALIEGRCL